MRARFFALPPRRLTKTRAGIVLPRRNGNSRVTFIFIFARQWRIVSADFFFFRPSILIFAIVTDALEVNSNGLILDLT